MRLSKFLLKLEEDGVASGSVATTTTNIATYQPKLSLADRFTKRKNKKMVKSLK